MKGFRRWLITIFVSKIPVETVIKESLLSAATAKIFAISLKSDFVFL